MIKTIDVYKESLYIRFDQGADTWKNISKHPNYKYWTKVLNYLRKRGFEIKIPQYFIETKWGYSTHKVAIKGDVVFCPEFMHSQIEIKFGNVQNLWKDHEHNFWSLTDNRATQLNYLQGKKVELEVKKLLGIFPQEIIKRHDVKQTFEEMVIESLNKNTHIHGKVTCLNDIKISIENGAGKHNQGRNSRDRDGKQIICGELKYYYCYYSKKLSCGYAWHNINNMWWVIDNGQRRNIASFELFDYNGEPRRKELTTEKKINRLERECRYYEDKKDYLRCMAINKQIEILKSSEKVYNVWSLKWNKWWGANNSGYTSDKRLAGIYLESNIMASQDYYNNGTSTKAVLV